MPRLNWKGTEASTAEAESWIISDLNVKYRNVIHTVPAIMSISSKPTDGYKNAREYSLEWMLAYK
jgi:hypothetical protein